jgi:hypothetical protein
MAADIQKFPGWREPSSVSSQTRGLVQDPGDHKGEDGKAEKKPRTHD